MKKKHSKTSIILTFSLLSIIFFNLIDAIYLYQKIPNNNKKSVSSELLDYVNKYEYELLHTTIAFSSISLDGYEKSAAREFDQWFNSMANRISHLNRFEKENHNVLANLDFNLLGSKVSEIKTLMYNKGYLTSADIIAVKNLFSQLLIETDKYKRNLRRFEQKVISDEQQQILSSYQNLLLSLFVSALISIIVVFYLFHNKNKLLDFQHSLEQRVYMRTKELKESNSHLMVEVQERKSTELKLNHSKLITEQAHKKIRYQASFDGLTKLANRRLFVERLTQATKKADESETMTAILFLDLDRFKHVNDTLGHSIGDKLLIEVSNRIQEVLRAADTPARFGGDEFAVVLTDIVEQQTIEMVVKRILTSLATPFRLSGHDAHVTASIGIAVYPADGKDNETLLRKADTAMYKAKDNGSNGFAFFTEQMDREADEQRLLETALYKAVEEKQFSLQYQPILNAHDQTISGVETILRWKHPQKNWIEAAEFMPLAEDLGVILPISEWMLKEACSHALAWLDDCCGDFFVSVNMSARQFEKCDMVNLIAQVLQDSKLPAQHLMIEIPEALLMKNYQQTVVQLNQIRNLGVRLAIDGFGTGYSSLSYLKKYPITTLKIDQSFIQDINIDPDGDDLIKGILSMAKNLNLEVVAEGVENAKQAAFLVGNSCLFLQGDYCSPVLSSEGVSQFIHQHPISASSKSAHRLNQRNLLMGDSEVA